MTDDSIDGRRIFGVLGVTVVALAGILGFVVGSNGASVAPTIPVVGGNAVPTTPLTMTLYGVVLATLSLCGLFALVTVASRFDEDRVD